MALKTHELLIDAALTLFSQNDYGNVTTRKIVAEAGVALPTLHRHFETKENLFRDVLKSTYTHMDGLRDRLLSELSEADNHSQILTSAVKTFVNFGTKDPRPLRLLVRVVSDPTAPRDQYRQSRNDFLDYVVELFPSPLPPHEVRIRVQVFLFGFSRLVTLDRSDICEIMGVKTWKAARPLLEASLIIAAHDCLQIPVDPT